MNQFKIKDLFPDVEQINIKVIDDNGWPWNRLHEFRYSKDSYADFHLDCPRPKCLGRIRGIDFRFQVGNSKNDRQS